MKKKIIYIIFLFFNLQQVGVYAQTADTLKNKFIIQSGYEGLNNLSMNHQYNGYFIDFAYQRNFLSYINIPLGVAMSNGFRNDAIGEFLTRYNYVYFYTGISVVIPILEKHNIALEVLGNNGMLFLDYVVENEDAIRFTKAELFYELLNYWGCGVKLKYDYHFTKTHAISFIYGLNYSFVNREGYNVFDFKSENLSFSRIGIGFNTKF